nr:MAG TPA: hypothetical protein [Caudoviricetes sp.]DAY60844.1 MAG TPA: hypothetical protein [Caudoviricetes sp.]
MYLEVTHFFLLKPFEMNGYKLKIYRFFVLAKNIDGSDQNAAALYIRLQKS